MWGGQRWKVHDGWHIKSYCTKQFFFWTPCPVILVWRLAFSWDQHGRLVGLEEVVAIDTAEAVRPLLREDRSALLSQITGCQISEDHWISNDDLQREILFLPIRRSPLCNCVHPDLWNAKVILRTNLACQSRLYRMPSPSVTRLSRVLGFIFLKHDFTSYCVCFITAVCFDGLHMSAHWCIC